MNTDNRLKEMRMLFGLTQEQLAIELDMSVATIKKYEGERQIPIESAIYICDKYKISLDWLYGRQSYMNEVDAIKHIIIVLSRVFKIRVKKSFNGVETILMMDSSFGKLIKDINNLELAQSIYINTSNENFVKLVKEIIEKNKYLFSSIISERSFNENDAIEIREVEFRQLVHDNFDLFTILSNF